MIDREIEKELLSLTTANGIATLSYSSLALGLLSGVIGPERVFSGDDQRKDNPRFSIENRRKVAGFAEAVGPVAEGHGASIAQVVIAWALAQPGGEIRLSPEDHSTIDRAITAWLSAMDG